MNINIAVEACDARAIVTDCLHFVLQGCLCGEHALIPFFMPNSSD